MDYETLATSVSSLGFPIIVCLILFKFIKEQMCLLCKTINAFNVTMEKNNLIITKLETHLIKESKE